MMEICEVRTKKEKKCFLRFVYDLYQNDPNFCDMNLTFVKIFLYKQDEFARRCKVLPIQMKEKGEIKLECLYVIDDTKEIKLSFLEFVPHAREYLEALLEYTKKLLRKYGKEKAIVGINGQISYGLGILTADYNREFEFNANYHKEYYTKEADEVFPVVKRAFSYQYDAEHSLSQISQTMLRQVRKEYKFRYISLLHFKRDMLGKPIAQKAVGSVKRPHNSPLIKLPIRPLAKPKGTSGAMPSAHFIHDIPCFLANNKEAMTTPKNPP